MNTQAKWMRIHYMPHTPLYAGKEHVTGSQAHIDLVRQIDADGTVLLKNENKLLPLEHGTRVAVFGKAQADYIRGGGGSGDVTTAYARSLLQGLRIKEQEGKLSLVEELSDFYQQYVQWAYATGHVDRSFANGEYYPGRVEEAQLPAELLERAKAATDTAIIAICRHSGEAADRKAIPGDFWLTDAEKEMIQTVLSNFSKVVVVLNIGGVVDTKWIKDDSRVTAALLPWQGGMEGGLAMADIICGDASPNGRLTDTFAESFEAYPFADHFYDSDTYVEYQEDIYVGYRYFETVPGAAEKVCYPFGYGLSYTKFDTEVVTAEIDSERFQIEVDVRNAGDIAGREVVQLYVQAPQGKLGKAARSLIGFAKTKTLTLGETQRLSIQGNVTDFASFDDTGAICKAAYVLEKGTYQFYIGRNVRDAEVLHTKLELQEDLIVQRLASKCGPNQLPGRMRSDGSIENLPTKEVERENDPWPEHRYPAESPWPTPSDLMYPHLVQGDEQVFPCLKDVYEGKISLDDFVDGLTLEQKVHLLGGQPNRGVAHTFGVGNLLRYGVPNVMTADGPAGLHIRENRGVCTTAFPCATLIACTWDPELARQVGTAAAEEVKENGLGIWLAPALNIHRNPLCGRNFEYYSEDPLISGVMAAATVEGVQALGIAATIKHFACNNKETNRREADARVSERALREIYLRGFEICVKRAKPWAVMSSYNLINGVHASANKELLTGILREEWGFDGLVMTDWSNSVPQYKEIAAGNDLKMFNGTPKETLQMIAEGKLSEYDVTASAKRVLRLILQLA